ncbi:MAG TPA: NAD(P)-binding protein [Bacteroidales bacterium]|nr:NAD(P)-binding protein [Bacteroidales bacterium]
MPWRLLLQTRKSAGLEENMMNPKNRITCLAELPTRPVTLDTMCWNQTGTWRFLTPVAVNKTPPCRLQCPAGMPIPGFINALIEKGATDALAVVLTQNPLPGLTSRLCYHPCQSKCIRRELDQEIAIQRIERHVADNGEIKSQVKVQPQTGRIAVFGAGPLGLSCAYFLKMKGFAAVVMDIHSKPGGSLLNTITDKVTPEVIGHDIERLIKLSQMELLLGKTILADDISTIAKQFDVVILDPTTNDVKSVEAGFPATFNPFDEMVLHSKVAAIKLPPKLVPFKPVMIAHYIAAGHLTAIRIADFIDGNKATATHLVSIDGLVTKNQIKLDAFRKSVTAFNGKANRHKVWNLEQVMTEANRCLSCGTCNQCGICSLYCPETSIEKTRNEISFDLYHCKGCGICAHECPRGVIAMEDIIS